MSAPFARGRRVTIAVAAVVLVAGAVVIAAPWRGGGKSTAAAAEAEPSAQTATVTRTDLSNSLSFDGTLGFGTPQVVRGAKDGTVTWLAPAGSTVTRNQPLYKVDEVPVPVFYGTVPLYRRLSVLNSVGHDVKMVADNLRALGFAIGSQPAPGRTVTITVPTPEAPAPEVPGPAAPRPAGAPPESGAGSLNDAAKAAPKQAEPAPVTSTRVTVKAGDGVLTRALVKAVAKWQAAAGMPATGALGPGDVAVLPGPVRVDAATVQVGDSAGAPLLKVTPTNKAVLVQVDAEQAGTIHRGDAVNVHLPGNATAAGTVATVGTAAGSGDDQGGGGQQKITVTVALTDPAKAARFDSAKVQAEFVAGKHTGVLTVPVTALLALREGGYGVQLPGGRIVPVKTGLFGSGMVEVSGAGLDEGAKVVIAS